MSVRDDARACLIKALHDKKNVDVTADQLNTLKPSDPAIGTQDGFAWLTILQAAVACLRAKGHQVTDPSQKKASDLLDALLIDSQLYLEQLATPQANSTQYEAVLPKKGPGKISPLLVASGLIIGVGAFALGLKEFLSRRRP